jgi:type III secretory pathway component EscT
MRSRAPTGHVPAVGVGAGRPSTFGAGGRPLGGWRALFSALAVLAVTANAVLMLSDRAPGFLNRASDRLERSERVAARVITESRVSDASETVHIVAWAVAMVLVGLAMWSWRSLFTSALALFAFSAVLEPAQELVTRSRSMQLSDVAANALGVSIGLVATIVVWSVVGLWRCRTTRRSVPRRAGTA